MIKVVCFDLDGVFFQKVHEKLVNNLSKRLDLDQEFIKEVLFVRAAEEGGYNKLKKGEIEPVKYWSWLWKTLGVEGEFSKDAYLHQLHKGYKINKRACDLINNLRSRGIKTAVCSNNYKDNIDFLAKKFNLGSYFDVIVFSYEVGAMKPDKRIFSELVKRCGVKPE
ncbi:HAD-IA family hydrolase [Candidatus Dojkabacteria bacterium]|nr:HAD-IA family hydrolase [Candidatus Dojkabacteria bacterium]